MNDNEILLLIGKLTALKVGLSDDSEIHDAISDINEIIRDLCNIRKENN